MFSSITKLTKPSISLQSAVSPSQIYFNDKATDNRKPIVDFFHSLKFYLKCTIS